MSRRLTPGQRRAVASYVAELQENLRLCVWRLDIAKKAAKRSAYATINYHDEAHEATIFIGPDFHDLPRADQRRVLVHELCHLVLAPIDHAVGRNYLAIGIGDQADDNFRPAMETANDDFAYLIAQHQPLPPKGWLDG